VRVPKDNLFTKYVDVSDAGQYKQVGDPRVAYGTMMFVRLTISTAYPKIYAQAIIIATRYSFFRQQGVGLNKQEINVLEYQTQQEKVLSRIAEYYAICLTGTLLRSINNENDRKIQSQDFSLLQETHISLAWSKCLFSEICQDGMEILRQSMGGHGTSYYSGVAQIMNEYAANNTVEG
jgi:acyl-CoA oxidase